MRAILVPVDGSSLAETALPTAFAVARRCGASHVDAVIVAPEPADPLHAGGAPVVDARLDHDLMADTASYAESLRGRLPSMASDVATAVTVLHGRPVETLAARALTGGYDLIVMTTHGRSGVSRAWLGSVADGLMRSTLTPVLLLRDISAAAPREGAEPFANVLIPLDGGAASEQIIPQAVAIAGRGASFHLLHVLVPSRWLPPPSAFEVVTAGAMVPSASEDQLAAARDAAVRRLGAVAQQWRAQGVQIETHLPVHQSPAEAILAYAQERGVSLIAMTSHGRSGAGRLMLGSVADKVVRGANVPVLVQVPTPG